jgi:uncharacterized membrane protein YjjB (DUF3815 family)
MNDLLALIALIAQDAFWAGLATLGFAMLFNVPKRALPYCMLNGALGHGTRALLLHLGMSIIPATLLGAILVGFIAKLLARRLEMPSMIFAITGAISMVPGVFAFQTMLNLLRIAVLPVEAVSEILVIVAVNAVKTGLILGALAAGIVMPALLFERQKPIV